MDFSDLAELAQGVVEPGFVGSVGAVLRRDRGLSRTHDQRSQPGDLLDLLRIVQQQFVLGVAHTPSVDRPLRASDQSTTRNIAVAALMARSPLPSSCRVSCTPTRRESSAP